MRSVATRKLLIRCLVPGAVTGFVLLIAGQLLLFVIAVPFPSSALSPLGDVLYLLWEAFLFPGIVLHLNIERVIPSFALVFAELVYGYLLVVALVSTKAYIGKRS
jgi:hypothetical protein